MSRHETNPFTGAIGAEYEMLRLICPGAAELAGRLARHVAVWRLGEKLQGFEIGCGTGVGTLPLLAGRDDLHLLAIDSSPKMLEQASQNLSSFLRDRRVAFELADALAALQAQPEASFDVITSSYATHNFQTDYRARVFAEISRVLKPGGLFLNGDRFAMDDRVAHLAHTQNEVRHWFKTFGKLERYDLLEEWVLHLFSDESPDHIMYLAPTLQALRNTGFAPVAVEWREGVDTLVAASKPA
jgi:ubiquinone/menaquinone biosynthesis C-methylase UbiE